MHKVSFTERRSLTENFYANGWKKIFFSFGKHLKGYGWAKTRESNYEILEDFGLENPRLGVKFKICIVL